jgi:hypothetical protein
MYIVNEIYHTTREGLALRRLKQGWISLFHGLLISEKSPPFKYDLTTRFPCQDISRKGIQVSINNNNNNTLDLMSRDFKPIRTSCSI